MGSMFNKECTAIRVREGKKAQVSRDAWRYQGGLPGGDGNRAVNGKRTEGTGPCGQGHNYGPSTGIWALPRWLSG